MILHLKTVCASESIQGLALKAQRSNPCTGAVASAAAEGHHSAGRDPCPCTAAAIFWTVSSSTAALSARVLAMPPHLIILLLQPRRLCVTTASSLPTAGELAAVSISATKELPSEDDLVEESCSRFVRDTCRLLELRGLWTPKMEGSFGTCSGCSPRRRSARCSVRRRKRTPARRSSSSGSKPCIESTALRFGS